MSTRSVYTFRKFLVALVATGIVVGVTILICEVGFRMLLFSDVAFMERFREPGLYTDYFSDDDWWKLYYAFNKPANDTAKQSHPLLGWAGEFSKETYLHTEAGQVGGRKPVLLYGDSFTHCVTAVEECFQGVLNTDKEFSSDHYLLNYGVAGYGVDQIYLLLKNSLSLYHRPCVIIGIHTRDLDRSILSFYVGQKPYFDVVADELVLRGTPIVQDPRTYGSNNPPQIWSYLYRLWLYQEGQPWRLRQYLRGTDDKQTRKERVNESLVLEMLREIENRHLQSTFIIFAGQDEIKRISWSEQFLADLFKRRGVRYISSRELIVDDMQRTGSKIEAYYLAQDGHPNAYQNLLVSKEMKRRLLLDDDALLRKRVASRSDEHMVQ